MGDSGDSMDSKICNFLTRTAGTILNTRMCVRGTREDFRKIGVILSPTIHCPREITIVKELKCKDTKFLCEFQILSHLFFETAEVS